MIPTDIPVSWWERQKVIISICGWWRWLYYSTPLPGLFDWAIDWCDYIADREYYEALDYKFSCVIDHATGGKLSKTNYDKDTYYTYINQHVEEQGEIRLEDAIADGEVKRVDQDTYR